MWWWNNSRLSTSHTTDKMFQCKSKLYCHRGCKASRHPVGARSEVERCEVVTGSTVKSGGSHLKCSRSERSDYSGFKSAYCRLLGARTGRFDVFAYGELFLFPSLRLCNPLSGQASEHCLTTVVSHTEYESVNRHSCFHNSDTNVSGCFVFVFC